jgi:hypothetical protein
MFKTRFLQFAVCGSVVIGSAACGHEVRTSRDPIPRSAVLVDVRDAAGLPLSGVAVRIASESSPSVAIAAGYTPANGHIRFGGLAPGAYDIDFSVPAGFHLQSNEKTPMHVNARIAQTESVVLVLTRQ